MVLKDLEITVLTSKPLLLKDRIYIFYKGFYFEKNETIDLYKSNVMTGYFPYRYEQTIRVFSTDSIESIWLFSTEFIFACAYYHELEFKITPKKIRPIDVPNCFTERIYHRPPNNRMQIVPGGIANIGVNSDPLRLFCMAYTSPNPYVRFQFFLHAVSYPDGDINAGIREIDKILHARPDIAYKYAKELVYLREESSFGKVTNIYDLGRVNKKNFIRGIRNAIAHAVRSQPNFTKLKLNGIKESKHIKIMSDFLYFAAKHKLDNDYKYMSTPSLKVCHVCDGSDVWWNNEQTCKYLEIHERYQQKNRALSLKKVKEFLTVNPEVNARAEEIINNDEWQQYPPNELFDFALGRFIFDQLNANKLFSKIYDLYKDEDLPISDPIGLLCIRHKSRIELLKSTNSPTIITDKKLNVAICVSGHLRAYKGNIHSLVNVLGLEHHNYRVFVHTWCGIERDLYIKSDSGIIDNCEFVKAYNECILSHPNPEEFLKNSYPAFSSLVMHKVTFDELRDEYKTTDIVIEDINDEIFELWERQKMEFYKVYKVFELAAQSIEDFNLMIRISPGLSFKDYKRQDILELYHKSKSAGSVFVCGGAMADINNPTIYMIDHDFAIGVPEVMKIYANTYSDFSNAINVSYLLTKGYSKHNTVENSLFCNGVQINRLERTWGMACINNESIKIQDLYGAIAKDITSRKKIKEDDILLDACKKDIESSLKDNQ